MLKFETIITINPERFDVNKFPNSKKFSKVTQAALKPNDPTIQYLAINKKDLTKRDIYTAQQGDILICLMNTKIRLIGIVDRFCIVPNTFCVLRSKSISTNALYALLKTSSIQEQLHSEKKSITLKDVKAIMLPHESSPAKNIVLSSLSSNWQNALLDRASFQDIIDNTFNNLKHTFNLKLEDFLIFSDITKTTDSNCLGKKDLPTEGILFSDKEITNEPTSILLTRKFKSIQEFKVGIIHDEYNSVKVNQNLLKGNVNCEFLYEIGLDKDDYTSLIFSKYIAYYFLSTAGKNSLQQCLESTESAVLQTLKISRLKQLPIPLCPNIRYVVEEIENQIYWRDAEKYSKQLDHSAAMFEDFETIITNLSATQEITYTVSSELYSAREYSLMLAQYLANTPPYNELNISVILESFMHYVIFERHHAIKWENEPIEFYSPNDSVGGDIIIVVKLFNQPLNIPKKSKIIFIEEQ